MDENIPSTEKTNICRCCLGQKNLQSIYCHRANEQLSMAEIYSICTSIYINRSDNLPNQICDECLQKLHDYYTFRQQCHESILHLEKIALYTNAWMTKKVERVDVEPTRTEPNVDSYIKEDVEALYTYEPNEPKPSVKIKNNCNLTCERDQIKKHTFTCGVCEKTFSRMLALRKHRSVKHGISNDEQCKFKCDTCGEKFKLLNKLKVHRRKVHRNGDVAELKCNKCDKTFTQANSLKQHITRHGERKFLCTDCGMSFYQYKDLERHSVRHTGERRFKCDDCHRAFLYKSSLAAHKKSHAGERPYQCHVCEKRFIHKPDMRAHIRLHDGIKHVCIVCGKTFTRADNLRVHMKSHGEMSLFCSICAKGFYDAGCLRKHEKTHLKREIS